MSSELIRVECLRALDRARILGELDDDEVAQRSSDVLQRLEAFTLAALSRRILDRAAGPIPSRLGTLDAIHIATAVALKRRFNDLALATHDDETATAATALEIRVLD